MTGARSQCLALQPAGVHVITAHTFRLPAITTFSGRRRKICIKKETLLCTRSVV